MTTNAVSVVMATYNGGRYIKEQLDSILNQSYPIYEIIVSDDGSTDDTIEIIREYQAIDNRIKLFHNELFHGPKGNFQNAFHYATGSIIAPSDQDDVWVSNRLELLIKNLTPNVDIVNAQDIVLWEDGTTEPQIWHLPQFGTAIWQNRLKGHTCIFRRELLSLYDFSSCVSWDYVLALYASYTGRIIQLDDCLVLWRRHKNAVTFGAFHKPNREKSVSKINKPKSNKWFNFLVCNKELFNGNKSDGFKKYITARYLYIDHLIDRKNSQEKKSAKAFRNVLYYASKQTNVSMIMAGVYSTIGHSYSENYKKMNFKNKLAHLLWAFREPYNQWAAVHNEKNLG